MPESIGTARQPFSLPPVWRRRLCLLGLALASLLTAYTLTGFFLAPYLLTRYAPRYAAQQLNLQLRPGQVRINPLLFTCEIRGLDLQTEGNESLLSVQRLFIDFELGSLFRRAWTFADLVVEKPTLHLVIGADGRLNLAKAIEKLPKTEESPDAEKKALPPLLLERLTLSGGAMQLADHSRSGPVRTRIAPIALALTDLSTLPGHRGAYTVSASLPDGASLGWQGEMSLQPISASGAIEIKDFKATTLWNLCRDSLNLAEPTGVAQLRASYHFSLRAGEPALRVKPISLTVRGLSLTEKGAAQPLLTLESFAAPDGQLDFFTRRMLLPAITLKGGQLTALIDETGKGNWQRLIKSTPPAAGKTQPPRGKPAADKAPPWRINIEALTVTDLDLRCRDADRSAPSSLEAELAISLAGGSLDLGRQEASLRHLALSGGGITFTLHPAIAGSSGAESRKAAGPEAGEATPEAETSPARKRPWKLALKQFTVSGLHLGFVDQNSKPPLACELTDLQAEVKDFDSAGEKPLTFAARTGVRQGGSASLQGTMSHSGGKAGQVEARLSIAQLNLKPLESLVAKHAALTLVSGDLSADTHLRYAPAASPPSLAVKGEAKIGKLLLNENDSGDRFLAWKELAASGLDFGLNPDRLNIGEVRLREPGAKIIIFKDKSLNLAKIGKQKDETGDDEARKPAFPVAVERVRLENGVVDFADFSLVLPFATRVERCRGAAVGLSSKPGSLASLKFEGRVGEFGQARAEGSLAPANPKQFTDIRVAFRNVAMPPLSPYSATFAGRTIAAGKLDLDLGYKIKNSELLGDNSVVLKDFTLGERVESPSAMDLPLDLAVALLTDSEGKIDIAVPIRGNVDHPAFSYGHVIRQALFNLLTKIVTAPFRALAALFGGDSENLDTVFFEPGRAELAPPEQEKLDKVAKALDKRTQLQLTVHGGFEPGLDGAALKAAQVRRLLAQRLGLKLEADEDPGPIAFDNVKTQLALENLAEHQLAAFTSGYEGLTGKKAKRVNLGMALLGRASEDLDFYRALFDYLVKTAPLPDAELQTLAGQRATAIARELTSRAGADPARITIGAAVQGEERDKGVPARLELGLP